MTARTTELGKANESLRWGIDHRKRVEESLRFSEERYRALYDANPSMYFTVDEIGKIISVNKFGAEQLGYKVEQLIGQSVFDIFYEQDTESVRRELRKYLKGPEKIGVWESRMVRKDGRLLWVRERVRTIRDRDGNRLILIVCDDINDLKQHEASIDRHVALLSKKNKFESIISSVTRSIHKSIDLNDVLENAVHVMSKNIESAQNVSIFLVEGKEAVLKFYRGNYPDWYVERVRRVPYPKGATWKAIRDGKTRYVADVEKDRIIGAAGREMGTESYVSLPIKFNGTAVAVININCFQKNAFGNEDLKVLEIVRQQIDIAFNNGKQAEAIRKSEEVLKKSLAQLGKKSRYESIISAVTRSVHQSITLGNVLENAVDSMTRNINRADVVSIYLLEGEKAVLKAHRGYTHKYLSRAGRIPYSKGVTWRTVIGNKPIYCPDVDQDGNIGRAGREMGIKCYLCMPIVFGRKPVGTLNIASYNKNAFDKEELMLLSIVAQQIGVAIKNASRAEALRKSELALQKANEELEDRVIERTKALSKANLALRGEIRKRRGAEEQIKSALKEKEVLLKEIQHRVKNNLQVIKSLIDLQSQFGENEDLKTILDETQTRIVAIALIHDLLYRSGNLRKIDFSEYSKNLTDYLFVSYGVNAKSIRLNINIGNNDMSVEIATICGMILNEFVSNSLKHAFRNGGKGEIFISLRPEKNSYILIVRDNGIGFPKGLNFRKTKTLGMQLVMSLVNQLDGSIKLRRINGTEFRIAFPDN